MSYIGLTSKCVLDVRHLLHLVHRPYRKCVLDVRHLFHVVHRPYPQVLLDVRHLLHVVHRPYPQVCARCASLAPCGTSALPASVC